MYSFLLLISKIIQYAQMNVNFKFPQKKKTSAIDSVSFFFFLSHRRLPYKNDGKLN